MWEDDSDQFEDADEILEQVYNHGSIVLGTDGCAMNWHLIVTGPHRGHVWLITDVGAVPFGEQFGYTTWLCSREWAADVHHFGRHRSTPGIRTPSESLAVVRGGGWHLLALR
ncbi:hypothetical protein [Streptomyces sp. NBC_01550]|uniref:hypothetical protein n=1 Tax=Streptomyces sp. NBC_01550 TaxID=2975875 RepID=UPI0038668B38